MEVEELTMSSSAVVLESNHGEKLKQLLSNRNISIQKFSDEFGKSRNWVYTMMGKSEFNKTIASAIALYFGVSPCEFGILPNDFPSGNLKGSYYNSDENEDVSTNSSIALETLKEKFRKKEERFILNEKKLLKMISDLTEMLRKEEV